MKAKITTDANIPAATRRAVYRRDGRAAFCAPTAPPSAPAGASGRTRRKGEEGARANAARRAHTDVWRGRQRRRSHNERRSGGIAPHRRERHSPSAEPIKAPEGA